MADSGAVAVEAAERRLDLGFNGQRLQMFKNQSRVAFVAYHNYILISISKLEN